MELKIKTTAVFLLPMLAASISGCMPGKMNQAGAENLFRLIVLDPGHFHAALLQQEMYSEIDPSVHVYARDGAELRSYLDYIDRFNTRKERPTSWRPVVYAAPDFLKKAAEERSGAVVMLAGNNGYKADYISTMVAHGMNILSDKPMAINKQGFEQLLRSFEEADQKNRVLYDIMTSRYDIVHIIQQKMVQAPAVFGELQNGSAAQPSIVAESVHHFYKLVAGTPLVRPAWYFDVNQQGEGIADVTTHLIDLVSWTCFPGQPIDYKTAIAVGHCRHWPTPVSAGQFKMVTGLNGFSPFLLPAVKDSVLYVYANGEINYRLKNAFARITVKWNVEAEEGGSDTHRSVIKGSLCDLLIRQDRETGFRPVLYLKPNAGKTHLDQWEAALTKEIGDLNKEYPGVSVTQEGELWKLSIPDRYYINHEEQFSLVVKKYLGYLKQKKLPDWEKDALLAKYYITTTALEKSMGR